MERAHESFEIDFGFRREPEEPLATIRPAQHAGIGIEIERAGVDRFDREPQPILALMEQALAFPHALFVLFPRGDIAAENDQPVRGRINARLEPASPFWMEMLENIRSFFCDGAQAALLEFRPHELRENFPDFAPDDLRVIEPGMFRDAFVQINITPLGIERGEGVADAAQHHLALREQIAHFALPPAGAQSHPHGADQSHDAKWPLQQREVGGRSEDIQHADAHLVGPAASRENDHREYSTTSAGGRACGADQELPR